MGLSLRKGQKNQGIIRLMMLAWGLIPDKLQYELCESSS